MSFAGRAPGRSFAAGFAQGGAAGDDENVETRRIRFEDELLEALRKDVAGEQSEANRERTAAAEAVIAKLTPGECEVLARRIDANKQGDALARALNEARTVGHANLKRLLDIVRSKRSGSPPTDAPAVRPAAATASEGAQTTNAREAGESSAARAVEAFAASAAPQPVSRARALGTFLNVHSVELKQRLLGRLADLPWPDPAEDVPFTRAGERVFGRALASGIAARLDDEQAIRDLLYPHDLDALLRRTVDLENAQLTPMFAGSFAQLIETAVRDSIAARVGPRLRAILDMRIPEADDITPGHPIDPFVIRAITIAGVLDYSNVAQTVADTPAPKGPSVRVDWFGHEHEGLWNCGRLSSKDVTREQLAVTFWGDSEKASMAAMIQIYGDIVRVEPSRARTLLPQRFPGARVGRTDPTEAEQIKAIAALSRGDAAPRQFTAEDTRSKGEPATKAAEGSNAKKRQGGNSTTPQAAPSKGESETVDVAKPPTIEQIMGVEKEIGRSLGTLRNQLAKVLLSDKLKPAFEHRAQRVEQLADADAETLAHWLPVLQFQHTQLLVIENQVAPAVARLVPLLFQPAHLLDDEKRASRAQLEKRLGNLADAASVSHLRDESTRYLAMNTEEDREASRRRADARQLELETSLDDARSAGSPKNPGNAVPVGAEAAATEQASIRRKGIDGKATENDQKRANVRAGIFALRARITAAHFRIDRVYIDAVEVFGDPESFHKLLPPQIKSLPEIVQRVRGHLNEVERVWDQDMAGIDSGMVDDSGDVDALAARLATAQDAFSRIAGDQSIVDFLNETTSRIRTARILTSVAQFAATCLITVGVGMAAAHLGNLARVALAGQGASAAVAVTADVAINVTINSALQVAQSGGEESAGVAIVENLLMEIFTRNLLAPLHKAERMAKKLASEYAQLPHLTKLERQALLELHTSSRTMMGTMVGTMAAQWAARQLRRRFQTLIENDSETEKREAKEAKISDDYALMVLQQGAAIGLGKYFAGKAGEWSTARNRLQPRIVDYPQLEPYLLARDAFYQDARALGESPSPDPTAGDHLMARDAALDLQEQAVFTQKGANAEVNAKAAREPSGESETAREPAAVADARDATTPAVVDKGLGARIAAEVPDARYVSGGAFEVEVDGKRVRVTVRRTNGPTRLVREGNEVSIEVAKGLDEPGMERAVVEKLAELRTPKPSASKQAPESAPKPTAEGAPKPTKGDAGDSTAVQELTSSLPVLDQIDVATGVKKGPAYERDMADLRQFYADMEAEGQQGVTHRGQAADGPYTWNYGHRAFTFSHGLVNFEISVHLDTSRVTAAEVAKLKQRVHEGVDRHYNTKQLKVRGPDGAEYRLHIEVKFVDDISASDIQVTALPGDGRAYVNQWHVDGDPTTHAHEVTHGGFGIKDEYVDPSVPDRARPNSPGVKNDKSIMGNYWIGEPGNGGVVDPNTTVQQRHLDEVSRYVPPQPQRAGEPAGGKSPPGETPSQQRPANRPQGEASEQATRDSGGTVPGSPTSQGAAGTGRVAEPKAGLYDKLDPSIQPFNWKVDDKITTERDGTKVVKTHVEVGGKTGDIERSYNPATKEFKMRTAFLEDLPRWVQDGVPMVDGRGTPTVTYLTLRQMKLLGVDYGGLNKVKMSTIQNIKAIIQLHVLRAKGVDPNVAVAKTHSVEYAETPIIQSGHQIVSSKIGGPIWKDKTLDYLLSHYELYDPAAAAKHDKLIQDFGEGLVKRDTKVWMNYDIELEVSPHAGPSQPPPSTGGTP